MVCEAATVSDAIANAVASCGPEFVAVLAISRIWLNGSDADADAVLHDGDELAILPPVSGG